MPLRENNEKIELISTNIAQDIILNFADTRAYQQADDFVQLFLDDLEIQNAIRNPENNTEFLTDADISEIQNSLSNFINKLFDEVNIINYPKIYEFILLLKKYNLNLNIQEPYFTFYTSDKILFKYSNNFQESLKTFYEIKNIQKNYPNELYDAISLHDFLLSSQNKLFQSIFETDNFDNSFTIKKENSAKNYNQKFDILNITESDLEMLYKIYIQENKLLYDKITHCNRHGEYDDLINQINNFEPTLHEACNLLHKGRKSANQIHYGNKLLMFHQLVQNVIILDKTEQKFETKKDRLKTLKKIKKFKQAMEAIAKYIPYSFGFNKYINKLQNILSIQDTIEMETVFKDLKLEMNIHIKHHIDIVKNEMQKLEQYYKSNYTLDVEKQILVDRLNKKFISARDITIQKMRNTIEDILADNPILMDTQTAMDLVDLELQLTHHTEILVIHAMNTLGENSKKASEYDDYINHTDIILEDLGIGIDVTFKPPDHKEYIALLQQNPKKLLTTDNQKKTVITIHMVLDPDRLNNYRSLVCHNIAQGKQSIPVKLFKDKKELYKIIRGELSMMRREISKNNYPNKEQFEKLHQQIEEKMNARLQRRSH